MRKGNRYIWPPYAVEQAGWVAARLAEDWTNNGILEALKQGEFRPTAAPAVGDG